jgi:hypothetical protein
VAVLTRRLAAAAAFVLLATVHAPRLGADEETSRAQALKAAFLFNFLRFVEWPQGARPAPVLCVAAAEETASVLEEALTGKRVDGLEVRVRALSSPDPGGCAIVFVPAGSTAAWPPVQQRISCRPVLAVGETPGFLEMGGSIALLPDGNRLRFDVNREAATCSGLRISSRLLSLARTVDGRRAER